MACSSNSYSTPCAGCKFLRRKCVPGCIFAPYFPPEEPQMFANVHKVFGASNVTKLLNELLPHQREDAVNSLAYEADARVQDPVYGCVGVISFLQKQVQRLQKELDDANADLIRYASNNTDNLAYHHHHHHQPMASRHIRQVEFNNRRYEGVGFNYEQQNSSGAYQFPWNFENSSGDINEGKGENI